MTLRPGLLVFVLLVACSTEARPTPTAAPTTAAPPPTPVPPAAPPSSAPPSPDAHDAIEAYRAAIEDWNAGNCEGCDIAAECGDDDPACAARVTRDAQTAAVDAFFGHFTNTLACWWGEPGRSAAAARAGTHWTGELRPIVVEVVRASADEVLLLDLGTYGTDPVRIHEKAILMRREGGAWNIAGETGRGSHGCLDEAFAFTSSAVEGIRACRDGSAPLFAAATADPDVAAAQAHQDQCLELAAAGDPHPDATVTAREQRELVLADHLEDAPHAFDARCQHAAALRTLGRDVESDSEYDRALAAMPIATNDAERHALAGCLLDRGRALSSAGRILDARADLERAVALEASDEATAALAALAPLETRATIGTWLDAASAGRAPTVPADALTAAGDTDARPRRALAHVLMHSSTADIQEVWIGEDGLLIARAGDVWRGIRLRGAPTRVSIATDDVLVRIDGRIDGAPSTTLAWWAWRPEPHIVASWVTGADVWVGRHRTVVRRGTPGQAPVFRLADDGTATPLRAP